MSNDVLQSQLPTLSMKPVIVIKSDAIDQQGHHQS